MSMPSQKRWEIKTQVPFNSFEYFEQTLITSNGFREYDVRWLLGKEVNPNGFIVLGKSYGTFTRRVLKQSRVVVGHDFRKYSQDLCNAFILGLLSSGVDVTDIGLAISPMLYFAQHCFQSQAGAMITASHNENGWTGIKLANGLSSTLGPEGIQTFREIVEGGDFESGAGSYSAHTGLYDILLVFPQLKEKAVIHLRSQDETRQGELSPGAAMFEFNDLKLSRGPAKIEPWVQTDTGSRGVHYVLVKRKLGKEPH